MSLSVTMVPHGWPSVCGEHNGVLRLAQFSLFARGGKSCSAGTDFSCIVCLSAFPVLVLCPVLRGIARLAGLFVCCPIIEWAVLFQLFFEVCGAFRVKWRTIVH